MIIDRVLTVWACESKHFSEGVTVDDFDERTGFYQRRQHGTGSPIEQNHTYIVRKRGKPWMIVNGANANGNSKSTR